MRLKSLILSFILCAGSAFAQTVTWPSLYPQVGDGPLNLQSKSAYSLAQLVANGGGGGGGSTSGTVSIANWPSSQAVTISSGTVSVVGGATAANQATIITSEQAIQASAAAIATTGSLGATAANQGIIITTESNIASSASSIATNGATAANQSTQTTALNQLHTDMIAATPSGTNTIGGVNIVSGTVNASVLAGGAVASPNNSALSVVLRDTETFISPQVLTPPTTNTLTSTGTVQAKIVPGGLYTFCCSIVNATLGGAANNLASCTTALGSTSVTYTGAAPSVGQSLGGTGITPGTYVTAVNAGVGFTMSLPANAAGTNTLAVTAGTFLATMQSSPDGSTWTTVASAVPKTFAAGSTATGTAVAPGLWTYQASNTDQYLRWNLTAIANTGVTTALTTFQLGFFIDAMDRNGSAINIPYIAYIASTASAFPAGIATILPIDRTGLSEISVDINAYAGTSQTITWRQGNDPSGILFSPLGHITTNALNNTASTSATASGVYRLSPSDRYFSATYAGTATSSDAFGGVTAFVGTQPSVQTVHITDSTVGITNNAAINLSQVGGSTPNTSVAAGSSNKATGVMMSTAVAQADVASTSVAGTVRYNSGTIASAAGGGVSVAGDIAMTVTTLAPSTGLIPVLCESYDSGTTWSDIWTGTPMTVTGHQRVPPIPIAGRRRWSVMSVGGNANTATVVITAQELPCVNTLQRQYVDIYAATNPSASIINGVSTNSTLVNTTLSSTSGIALIEGCKAVTISGVFTGGTPTVNPVYTLQLSMDATNWQSTTTTIVPTTAGCFMASLSNVTARYARLIITTASSGGTPWACTYTSIYGTN